MLLITYDNKVHKCVVLEAPHLQYFVSLVNRYQHFVEEPQVLVFMFKLPGIKVISVVNES